MKLSQPIGRAGIGPLLLRVPLGAYFILAGLAKFENIPGFVTEVQKFGKLPEHLAILYGTLLPYVEVAVGGMLVIGLFVTLASLLASLMLASFIIAIGLFPSPLAPFNKDVILLGGALALMYTGAGMMSVDGFRNSGAGG